MNTSSAVAFSHVTKTFAHHSGQKLLRERLAELLRPRRERFTALDDLSFEIARGESLALIGPNGAGKSTVLNLATGLMMPDAGRVDVRGRVAAMLELGAGFHPDLTGAENVRINAALTGLSRREAAESFESIIEFSGVREFIHEPLRTYSAGMIVRLAFSVAVQARPDVLVTDEVIGMGDQHFYASCLEKFKEFQQRGTTILLASHSLDLVEMLCQRTLWLDHGRVVKIGPTSEVIEAYRKEG